MQKKLYFLNEEEKNRILNLHESRTKNQYLLNEGPSRESFNKKINDICNAGTYGTGNLSPTEVQEISGQLSNIYLKPNSGYMNNDSLNRMTQLIYRTKLISNFCLVLKKFNETTQRNLMREFDRFIYQNTAWDLTIRVPLDNLIKTSDEFKQKSDADYQKISQGTKSPTSTGSPLLPAPSRAPVTGMGSVLISPQQVTTLRTSAGLTGTGNSLSQQDINDLYALINKLPNPNKK